jgi:hypothetical protein
MHFSKYWSLDACLAIFLSPYNWLKHVIRHASLWSQNLEKQIWWGNENLSFVAFYSTTFGQKRNLDVSKQPFNNFGGIKSFFCFHKGFKRIVITWIDLCKLSPCKAHIHPHVEKVVFIYVKIPINKKVSLIWSWIHTKVQLYNFFLLMRSKTKWKVCKSSTIA